MAGLFFLITYFAVAFEKCLARLMILWRRKAFLIDGVIYS
ncbi:hypothetical protein N577_011810 [Lacticaseibacillus rhamnosus 2166]|nr:hypothetical protein N577_011810 [Lacticaseibacillus rhamnosus 2166]